MVLIKDRTQGMQGITIYNQKWRLRDGYTLLLGEIVEKKPLEATMGSTETRKTWLLTLAQSLKAF